MSDLELYEEYRSNAQEMQRLEESRRTITTRDKILFAVNAGLGSAGLILAPPTGGASFYLTLLAAGALGLDIAGKIDDIHFNAQLNVQLHVLESRNELISREFFRRHP